MPEPLIGAVLKDRGVHFRVWAPEAHSADAVLVNPSSGLPEFLPLDKGSDGYFAKDIPGIGHAQRYRLRVDGGTPFPDPASRFQPEGVHGPSQVVDLDRYSWQTSDWSGHAGDDLVFYELHLGTFSPEGTFAGAAARLPYLRDLGITAVELLPVADFPGSRNWGYDGVSLFAPARCYGTPEDLQRLVDEAHRLGLSIFLDVVYNHFGPDGNYTGVYSPHYLSRTHRNPWGDCLNFDGPQAQPVRDFFTANAIQWLRDYRFDGLRLDATHAILDESPRHFLAELSTRVHAALPGRRVHLVAEDHRNLAHMVKPVDQGGWGLDGVWADDFHHETRRLLAGDDEGYYRDFRGRTDDLATILDQGWLYTGQFSKHLEEPRGSDPTGLAPEKFVVCIQNHDQIGNRAFGERLNHQVEARAYRAASAVLLLAPQAPLLFMGQEWAASTPFRFFTDHNEELGKLVTEGRRREFKHFRAFADPETRERIPDPQAEATFTACRLLWEEIERPEHAGILNLYRTLLHLRRTEPALRSGSRSTWKAEAPDENTLLLRRRGENGQDLLLVARLKSAGPWSAPVATPEGGWETVLHSEETRFGGDGRSPAAGSTHDPLKMAFTGPCAVLLRAR